MRLRAQPVLLLAGAVVVIDAVCDRSITSVFRRNRGETLAAGLWFLIHVMKEETR